MKQPQFTESDLREIYYAVESKLRAPAVQSEDRVAVEWRAHLRQIIAKIKDSGAKL